MKLILISASKVAFKYTHNIVHICRRKSSNENLKSVQFTIVFFSENNEHALI